jgi:hypothetical protein
MAAFWPVFTFWGSDPATTAHGSLDFEQEIQIEIQIWLVFMCAAGFSPTSSLGFTPVTGMFPPITSNINMGVQNGFGTNTVGQFSNAGTIGEPHLLHNLHYVQQFPKFSNAGMVSAIHSLFHNLHFVQQFSQFSNASKFTLCCVPCIV